MIMTEPVTDALQEGARIIRAAGLADDERINVCVERERLTFHVFTCGGGDARERMENVEKLADAFGATPWLEYSRNPWVTFRATIEKDGVTVDAWTVINVRRNADDRPLATSIADGTVKAFPDWGNNLPDGWRWLTELDEAPVVEGAAP